MTVVEAAASAHFSRDNGALEPLEVPEAVLPLACAAEFDTVYITGQAFVHFARATRHIFGAGFDESRLPAAEGPAAPERMTAVQLLDARRAVLDAM